MPISLEGGIMSLHPLNEASSQVADDVVANHGFAFVDV